MKKILIKLIENILDNLNAGTSDLSEEECIEAIEFVKQMSDKTRYVSKSEACMILKCSPATFDRLVANGELKRGKKLSGFKELHYNLMDIENYNKSKHEDK